MPIIPGSQRQTQYYDTQTNGSYAATADSVSGHKLTKIKMKTIDYSDISLEMLKAQQHDKRR